MNSVVKSSWKNCLHWHGLGLSASATCRGPARRWMPLTSPQVHAVWGHEIKFIKVFRFLEKKNGSLFSPSLSTTKTRTHWKRPWCWERLKAGEGTIEDEMVEWHYQLGGHEFEQAPGAGDGQESLVCCSPWGRKESDTTKWLNWTELETRPVKFHSSE